jgi:PhzF family phenazine biosynthesis protein
VDVLRYTAFTTDPAGGNPAGIVLDAGDADDAAMLRTAAAVGYSETAFLTPRGDREFDVRYFSPRAEVPFCGHATIAAAVAYADRHGTGPLTLHTPVGDVAVATREDAGVTVATLTSVEPRVAALDDLDELLAALDWRVEDLDPALPPRVAFAGAWHPVLAAATRERLARLDYDYDRLATLMAGHDWTTVDLVHRVGPAEFHARNPFPPGGIVEDPATGAAAAALGGYLRALNLVAGELRAGPATITVRQGDDLGRPSTLTVTIPPRGGIDVSGAAVPLPPATSG